MAEPDIKRLPISEFRERGYLHEVNRLLLHPLGLALEVRTVSEPMRQVWLSEYQAQALEGSVQGLIDRMGYTEGTAVLIVDALRRAPRYEPGDEALSGIWDCRDDPEGVVYGEDLLDQEKAERVCGELLERRDDRKKHTGGWVVQPIPDGQVLSTTYTDPELRTNGGEVVERGQFAGVELPEDHEAP